MSQEPQTGARSDADPQSGGAWSPAPGRHLEARDGARPGAVPPGATLLPGPAQAPSGPGGPGGPGGPPAGEGPLRTARPPTGGGPPAGRHRSLRRWLLEWGIIIVVAVLVAFVVRTYVAQTYYVPSTSMWPTLKAGDRIVVNKLFGPIHRGDIIVFKRPPAEDCGGAPVPDLVKRVIGLPGELLAARNGHVYVTGHLLPEPWLPPGPQAYTSNFGPLRVPAGDYFVMGDNRVNSCDSRMWGPVKQSYVVGKVFLILWPPSRFRFF